MLMSYFISSPFNENISTYICIRSLEMSVRKFCMVTLYPNQYENKHRWKRKKVSYLLYF